MITMHTAGIRMPQTDSAADSALGVQVYVRLNSWDDWDTVEFRQRRHAWTTTSSGDAKDVKDRLNGDSWKEDFGYKLPSARPRWFTADWEMFRGHAAR
jgi:hypothetical protein